MWGDAMARPLLFTPSVYSLTLIASSSGREPFWVQYKHGVQCRTPRGAIVSMGLRGSPGGLRGEIEIFPGPLAKRVVK